jgi:tRNA dimethylallyltransferase
MDSRPAPDPVPAPVAPSPEGPLPPLVVIAGATATGKTRLSLALAPTLGAEIVAADSRQVYRGMDIGTAKPTPAERAEVPHHGLDLVDPDEPFSAADYLRHALEALRGVAARGRPALLVGGTGLYLRAVARGLPLGRGGSDPAVRATLEARLDREGLGALVTELGVRAPETRAAIDARNPRRVVRALERAIVAGTAAPPPPEGYPAPVLWLGLRLEAAEHRASIATRAAEQFAGGLLEEAAALRARYPESLRAFSALGYREAFDVLAGRSTTAEAVARDAQRTWAYAKRQATWFRSEPDVTWLRPGEGTGEATLVAAASARTASFLDSAARGYAGPP